MVLKPSLLLALAALAACEPALAQFTPPVKPPEASINVLGWSDYIAPQAIDGYARAAGVRIVYDAFDSEAAFAARQAESKGYYDIITPPARLLPGMIAAGRLQKLERSAAPAARELWPEIAAKLAALDPGNQYALAHMWFGYGLAYDRAKAAERLPEAQMASWDLLFRPETLKKFSNCGVQLPDDADLVFQVALLAQKLPGDLRLPGDLKRAADAAGRLRTGVAEFRSGGAASALADGEICLALLSASEAAQARERGRAAVPPRDIGFAVPREGAPMGLDALAVPRDAPHAAEAIGFIAYLQRPEIAALNSAAAGLASGVAAARPLLPEAARTDRFIWPDDETLRRLVALPAPDPALRKMIEREWLKVKTGSYEAAPAEPAGKPPGKAGKGGRKDKGAPPKPGAEPAIPDKKPKRPKEKPTG